MGKAIVINGLNVANPIETVDFTTAERVFLNDYYTAVGSDLTDGEKSALETFIKKLIGADLIGKMSYLYPMLGSTVATQLTNIISPSTDDIKPNVKLDYLSVSNRMLQCESHIDAQYVSPPVAGTRLAQTDLNDFGCITVTNNWVSEQGGTCRVFELYSTASAVVGLQDRYGKFNYVSNNAAASINGISDLRDNVRIVSGFVKDGVATNYHNSSVINTASVNNTTAVLNRTWNLFDYKVDLTTQLQKYKGVSFVALTKGLTAQEWAILYGYIVEYLTALGKNQ